MSLTQNAAICFGSVQNEPEERVLARAEQNEVRVANSMPDHDGMQGRADQPERSHDLYQFGVDEAAQLAQSQHSAAQLAHLVDARAQLAPAQLDAPDQLAGTPHHESTQQKR